MEFHSQRVSIIKLFVNKYRWTGRNYLSKIDDWETFEKNNPNLTLNMLYIKEKEICPALPFKIDLNCEKQIILLMIPKKDKKGWHYLPVKKKYLEY